MSNMVYTSLSPTKKDRVHVKAVPSKIAEVKQSVLAELWTTDDRANMVNAFLEPSHK